MGNTETVNYDQLGRVIRSETPFDNSNNVKTLTYYDNNGNIIKTKEQNNKPGEAEHYAVTEYEYDSRNRLTCVKVNDGERDIYTQYAYDNVGTYDLTAHILLPENVYNEDGYTLTISVQTKKYTITSVVSERVNGVISGTPFEEVPLPEKVTAVYVGGNREALPVTWDGSNYNPTKIGTQAVRGDFKPQIHVENPNNRRPAAAVTIVDPNARILSLEQISDNGIMLFGMGREDEEAIPGFTEYKFEAEVQWADGSITTEIISMFEEADVE